jgi:hypothetical protein
VVKLLDIHIHTLILERKDLPWERGSWMHKIIPGGGLVEKLVENGKQGFADTMVWNSSKIKASTIPQFFC